jgi:SAM-dependent methyltransferase
VIKGHAAIRDAYRDDIVVRRYVNDRFREPLGALLHARQIRALQRVIDLTQPNRILEIAPGPARLTVDLVPRHGGTIFLVDASAAMLNEARRRLSEVGVRSHCVQGDVFQLPVQSTFDLVYSFRLIRHFDDNDRVRIYAEIARVLRPGGVLVLDAVNEAVSAPLRAHSDPGEHRHFDALFRRDGLKAELSSAGFEIVSLEGAQRRYPVLYRIQTLIAPRSSPVARAVMEAVDRLPGGQPLEWTVVCRRA